MEIDPTWHGGVEQWKWTSSAIENGGEKLDTGQLQSADFVQRCRKLARGPLEVGIPPSIMVVYPLTTGTVPPGVESSFGTPLTRIILFHDS